MKIKSIRRIPFKGSVFNLTLENSNNIEGGDSYICNGVVVGNCIFLDGTMWPVGSTISDH